MRFAQFTTSLLAFATAGRAKMSSDAVVANIDEVTQLSADTNKIAARIGLLNFFLLTPQMVNNFGLIITVVTKDIAAMGENEKRAIEASQGCINSIHVGKCLEDIGDLAQDTVNTIWPKKRQSGPPYNEANQQAICAAFRGFVQVHQTLLATVIGKHGLLSFTPFTGPIAEVLRALEEVVDTLAFGIIALVPSCAQSATQNKNALDRSLREAIATYD